MSIVIACISCITCNGVISRITRTLYEKPGKNDAWLRYITRLGERNRGLKALQSVLATAGL